MKVWSLTLYYKREVNALFICKLPKINVLKEKIGSKLDTTEKGEEVCLMDTNLNVAIAPKDSTFQVRINSDIKKAVEDIYAKTGMTLTDAFNTFIQQSLNVEGLPFIVTKNSKEALREQAVAMLMLDLKRSEERAEIEGWIDADDLERELGVID